MSSVRSDLSKDEISTTTSMSALQAEAWPVFSRLCEAVMHLSKADIATALANGGTMSKSVAETLAGQPLAALPPAPEPHPPVMVEASVTYQPAGTQTPQKLTVLIPCVTRSDANESAWVKKMKRKLSSKRATRETLGPRCDLLTSFCRAYHAGQALRVMFTRMGGRRLDRGNLSVSMKAVEDVVAGALLADDGSPQWVVSYEQEPGGLVGVRVEIEVMR